MEIFHKLVILIAHLTKKNVISSKRMQRIKLSKSDRKLIRDAMETERPHRRWFKRKIYVKAAA